MVERITVVQAGGHRLRSRSWRAPTSSPLRHSGAWPGRPPEGGRRLKIMMQLLNCVLEAGAFGF
jgi:hypothetical protein